MHVSMHYMRGKRTLFTVSSFVVSIFLALLWAQSVEAVEYGGIGGKPAYPRADNPRTESIFIHEAEAGNSVTDGVLVVNNTEEEVTLNVYAVDSIHSSDGAFACAQQADESTGVGTWITLELPEVTLQRGEEHIVPFTITIPDLVDVGEQNGCIVIQEKAADPTIESGMSISFRSAIRVAVTVPGDIVRKLSVAEFNHSVGENGRDVINVSVRNEGNVSLDATVHVTTRSLFNSTWPEQGGQYPVLRDQLTEWHYELPVAYWGGWYQSSLLTFYDAASAAALGKDSGEAATELYQQTDWFFVQPTHQALWIYISVLCGLIVILIIGMIMMRRRRQLGSDWQPYTIHKGDDLKKLADRFGTQWKTMATVNGLKAPFVLKAGQVIRAPHQTKKPDTQKNEENNENDEKIDTLHNKSNDEKKAVPQATAKSKPEPKKKAH